MIFVCQITIMGEKEISVFILFLDIFTKLVSVCVHEMNPPLAVITALELAKDLCHCLLTLTPEGLSDPGPQLDLLVFYSTAPRKKFRGITVKQVEILNVRCSGVEEVLRSSKPVFWLV